MTATLARPRPPAAFRRLPATVWFALGVVYIVWGSTYLGIRVVVETMPAMASAGVRFGLAALVLGLFLSLRKGLGVLRVTRRQLASCALIGILLLTGGNGGVTIAESMGVTSGLTALIVAVVPLWVVCLRFATGDRVRALSIAGVMIGFSGVALLVLPGRSIEGVTIAGILVVIGGTMSWAIGSFLSSRIEMPRNPFVATVWEMLFGALGGLVVAGARGEFADLDLGAVSGRSWVAFTYLFLAGSVFAFSAYVYLLHNAPVSLAATYAYVNPAIAVALGALILSEPVTAMILLGGGVIVVGVIVVVTAEGRRQPASRATRPDELELDDARAR